MNRTGIEWMPLIRWMRHTLDRPPTPFLHPAQHLRYDGRRLHPGQAPTKGPPPNAKCGLGLRVIIEAFGIDEVKPRPDMADG